MIHNITYPISIQNNKFAYNKKCKNISFKNNIHSLSRLNIGTASEGYIGKVKVRKGLNTVFLDVYKKILGNSTENYTIQNDKNDIIGNINLLIIKPLDVSWNSNVSQYVFVDELRNFSHPQTPYHNKKLEYFKDIGTRLLQIAEQRSYEANCDGNIKLVSKQESMQWYKDIIGMKQEYPIIPGQPYFHNPNLMYLPAESKEKIAKLQGGL